MSESVIGHTCWQWYMVMLLRLPFMQQLEHLRSLMCLIWHLHLSYWGFSNVRHARARSVEGQNVLPFLGSQAQLSPCLEHAPCPV